MDIQNNIFLEKVLIDLLKFHGHHSRVHVFIGGKFKLKRRFITPQVCMGVLFDQAVDISCSWGGVVTRCGSTTKSSY